MIDTGGYAEIALRMLVALVLGVIVGLERQFHDQAAGMRTASLVSIGACAFVMFSVYLIGGDGDLTRVAAQVVTGVGFLGAGVIIHDGISVRGLTTAATMWCTAALGVLAGGGFYYIAGLLAAGILLVNIAMRPLSKRIGYVNDPGAGESRYALRVTCKLESWMQVREALVKELERSFQLDGVEMAVRGDEAELCAHVATSQKKHLPEKSARTLSALEGVMSVAWQAKIEEPKK